MKAIRRRQTASTGNSRSVFEYGVVINCPHFKSPYLRVLYLALEYHNGESVMR